MIKAYRGVPLALLLSLPARQTTKRGDIRRHRATLAGDAIARCKAVPEDGTSRFCEGIVLIAGNALR